MSEEKKNFISRIETISQKNAEIKFHKEETLLGTILIDDEDNTLFGEYTDKSSLSEISEQLLGRYGAKEFIFIPHDAEIFNFTTPNNTYSSDGKKFERTLHASKLDFQDASTAKVNQYNQFAKELDSHYRLVDLNFILNLKSPKKLYQELCNFLKDNANFTPGKMKEYAEGDIIGMKNRFERTDVISFLLIDKDNNIVGTLRALQYQDRAYLSDECVYVKIFPAENFSSADEHRTFLMAYLVNKAFSHGLEKFNRFFLIGAEGRVHQYCNIGCKPFTGRENFDGSKLVISLSPSKLENIKATRRELNAIKKEEAFSASSLGASLSAVTNQNPVPTAQAQIEPETQSQMNL